MARRQIAMGRRLAQHPRIREDTRVALSKCHQAARPPMARRPNKAVQGDRERAPDLRVAVVACRARRGTKPSRGIHLVQVEAAAFQGIVLEAFLATLAPTKTLEVFQATLALEAFLAALAPTRTREAFQAMLAPFQGRLVEAFRETTLEASQATTLEVSLGMLEGSPRVLVALAVA